MAYTLQKSYCGTSVFLLCWSFTSLLKTSLHGKWENSYVLQTMQELKGKMDSNTYTVVTQEKNILCWNRFLSLQFSYNTVCILTDMQIQRKRITSTKLVGNTYYTSASSLIQGSFNFNTCQGHVIISVSEKYYANSFSQGKKFWRTELFLGAHCLSQVDCVF